MTGKSFSGLFGSKMPGVRVSPLGPYWNASIDTILAFLFFFVKSGLAQEFSALLQLR